jgi:hypothetical protein
MSARFFSRLHLRVQHGANKLSVKIFSGASRTTVCPRQMNRHHQMNSPIKVCDGAEVLRIFLPEFFSLESALPWLHSDIKIEMRCEAQGEEEGSRHNLGGVNKCR